MAKFTPAFAHAAARRFQNSDEAATGFNCMEALRELFNGLQYGSQAEIGEVITHAGLTPSNEDFTQFRKAIVAMINDAVAGIDIPTTPPDPDTSPFLRLNLARQRFPIFPFVDGNNGRAGVYSPAPGVVRLPGGVWITHRGIYQFSTHQQDFATTSNKVYHLRWTYNPTTATGTYELLDLADTAYNPGGLSENDPSFDTSFDSMLLARVITTATNACVVSDLANRLDLSAVELLNFTVNFHPAWYEEPGTGLQLNWGRTPFSADVGFRMWKANVTDVDGRRYPVSAIGVLQSMAVRKTTVDRYGCGNVQYSYNDTIPNNGHFHVEWAVEA